MALILSDDTHYDEGATHFDLTTESVSVRAWDSYCL